MISGSAVFSHQLEEVIIIMTIRFSTLILYSSINSVLVRFTFISFDSIVVPCSEIFTETVVVNKILIASDEMKLKNVLNREINYRWNDINIIKIKYNLNSIS